MRELIYRVFGSLAHGRPPAEDDLDALAAESTTFVNALANLIFTSQIPELIGVPWLAVLVKIGALMGLTSVILVFLYGQSRIFFTMSRDGLAAFAAASIDSLISFQLGRLIEGGTMSLDDRTRLSEVFAIGNDADATRLLQIRIRRLDGAILYESNDGLIEPEDGASYLDAAAQGECVDSYTLLDLNLGYNLRAMEIQGAMGGSL